jgi:hypothetical protein
MIGLINNDSSFFEISSDDINLDNRIMSESIIKLSITEQRNAMTQGSISFLDPDNFYSRILRTGVNIKLDWGYRDNLLRSDLINKIFNPNEIDGSLIRKGTKAFISSPSGSGGNDGKIIYNCNFTCYSFKGLEGKEVFSSGTKRDVINKIFDKIGISKTKRFIAFRNANDKLTTERIARQDEPDFQFLTKLAREWSAIFSVGFSPKGEKVAIFMDTDKIGENPIPLWVSNATGSTHALGYKGEINNVISYTWKSNESENGNGANVQMQFVDGQVVFKRFAAEQKQITTYKLRPDKINEVLKGEEGIVAQTRIFKDLFNAKNFEEIKHFFDPYESSLAPQGFGYRISAQMLGNPLFMPPNQIIINNGFPDRLGGSIKQIDPTATVEKYYLDKISHNIDKAGYKMGVDIIDSYSFSEIGKGFV